MEQEKKKEPLAPPPALETHCWGLNWNHNRAYRVYENEHFNNQLWHAIDFNTARIGFSRQMFGWDDIYYDGIWLKTLTLFWIEFSYGSFWAAEPKES